MRENDSRLFVLPLPKPEHDGLVLNSSEITVLAASSIQLTPDIARSSGLTPVPMDDSTDSSTGEAPGQEFRYRGFYYPMEFAARKRLRAQRVVVAAHSQVDLSADRITVEQTLDLDVRHQPISELSLAVPNGLTNLELQLLPSEQGEEQAGVDLELASTAGDSDFTSPLVPERLVPLPHPRLGKFRIRARYLLDPKGTRCRQFHALADQPTRG